MTEKLLTSNHILIGKCSKSHALKGGAAVHFFSGEETILEAGMDVVLLTPRGELQKKVTDVQVMSNKVVVFFAEVNTLTDLEKIMPFDLYLHRDFFPEIDEEEADGLTAYHVDLMGLDVYDLSQNKVGVVEDIYENGPQSVLVIRDQYGKKIDVPYVSAFVHEVNLKDRFIKILVPQMIE